MLHLPLVDSQTYGLIWFDLHIFYVIRYMSSIVNHITLLVKLGYN